MKELDGETYLTFAEAAAEVKQARNNELAHMARFIAKHPQATSEELFGHIYTRSPAVATAMYEGPTGGQSSER